MTAQISDTFIFKGKRYELIGMTEGELFSPEGFGLKPQPLHTACWRGFYATYKLLMSGLYLNRLTVKNGDDNYPPIEGVEAVQGDYCPTYQRLKVPVPFTGKIRLARDFIDEYYVHMGYQKPTAYKTVLDITLNEGRVTSIKDRSDEMGLKRGAFKEQYESGDIMQVIDEAFSLDMDIE